MKFKRRTFFRVLSGLPVFAALPWMKPAKEITMENMHEQIPRINPYHWRHDDLGLGFDASVHAEQLRSNLKAAELL